MNFTPAKASAHARAAGEALAVAASAIVLTAALLLAGCSSSRSFVPESSVTPGPLESNGPISWTEAASRVGEVLSVQGPVAGTGSDGAGGVTLDVGAAAPDPARFVVVIPEAALEKFPKDPAAFYDGQLLTATGLIEDRGGTAAMVVGAKKDLKTGL
jgi:hypothetical protein